jgi:Protein of unknown function (DUF1638)
MRIKCLACEALARPTYLAAALSPHIVDVEMVQRGLHNRPAHLREHLQRLVDSFDGSGYDAVTLVYGLCGQAIAGLVAREARLVVPKAHDCITLFLGSRERYTYQFDNFPGTYWYSHDYIERDDGSGSSLSMGSGTDTDLEAVYEEYVSKYGKDNADYLMEAMGAWQSHYQRAVFIDMGIGDASHVEQRARQEAARRGWSFERMAGDLNLIRRLLNGDWEGDFLVLEPGQAVSMSYDEDIISSQRIED